MPWGLHASSSSSSSSSHSNILHPQSRRATGGSSLLFNSFGNHSDSQTSTPANSAPPSRTNSPQPTLVRQATSGSGNTTTATAPGISRNNSYDHSASASTEYPPGDPLSAFYGGGTASNSPVTSGFPHDIHSQTIPGHSNSHPHSHHSSTTHSPVTSAPSSYISSHPGLSHASSFASTYSMLGGSGSGSQGYHGQAPLEILVDTDQITLRGQGSDSSPALLSGTVVLNLTEATNIRELTMRLEGRAKVAFVENSGSSSKSHHYTHQLLTFDWSFLEGGKKHSHTLKAGRHAFPFSYTFEGNHPSSLRTYTNDGNISYRLRATATRNGAFSPNFHATRPITVVRSFASESLEFNQTLEIENTWPGKVMYCLTLAHKAYAAGDEIPVSIKFMPLAKGTRVSTITSVIKEYSLVSTRHSQHPEARVANTVKHEIREGRAYRVREPGMEPIPPSTFERGEDAFGQVQYGPGWQSSNNNSSSRNQESVFNWGRMDGTSTPGFESAPPSRAGSPTHGFRLPLGGGSGTHTPSEFGSSRQGSYVNMAALGGGQHSGSGEPTPSITLGRSSRDGYFPTLPSGHSPSGSGCGAGAGVSPGGNAVAGPSSGAGVVSDIPDDLREQEDITVGDEEIDTMITIPIPPWTTPSHSLNPVQVTHKIKWSCSITNPDGHISELRCALPIHILANTLLEEAHVASSGTRALLFGGGGDAEAPQIDLPSYNDHVYDRVANSVAQGSGSTTTYVGRRTPGHTPPVSRGPSRPGSPNRGMSSRNVGNAAAPAGQNHDHPEGESLDGLPQRPQLGDWADSELLLSLGALAGANGAHTGPHHNHSSGGSPHDTPSGSGTPSRNTSRANLANLRGRTSNPNSRPGSRANSPERGASGGFSPNLTPEPSQRPLNERRSSSGTGLFHLPVSMKPFTSIGGRHVPSGQRTPGISGSSGQTSVDHSPLHSPHLMATNGGLTRSGFSLGSHAAFTSLAEDQAARGHGPVHPGQTPTQHNLAVLAPSPNGSGSSSPRHTDPLSQVPSYAIAAQGFLGGGVVPISAGPPTYDEAERFERTKSESALSEMGRAAEAAGGPSSSTHQAPSLAAIAASLNQLALNSAGGASSSRDGPGRDGERDTGGENAEVEGAAA